MAQGKFGIIGAFTLGFAVGASAQKWWPILKEKLGPLGKDLVGKGLDAVDKAKDVFWEKSEKFADVISEIKEEQEMKHRRGPTGGEEEASPKVKTKTRPEPVDN